MVCGGDGDVWRSVECGARLNSLGVPVAVLCLNQRIESLGSWHRVFSQTCFSLHAKQQRRKADATSVSSGSEYEALGFGVPYFNTFLFWVF